jgi:hypothetical protein
MAEYTCKDINGNEINQFVFDDNGVVYGLVNSSGSETTYEGTTLPYNGDGDLVNLSSECCNAMNFDFNSNNGKCYYQEISGDETNVKIVFNVNEDNGVVFTKLDSEECSLQLNFDFLIEYDSDIIFEKYSNENLNVVDILNGLDLSVVIEKYGFRDINAGENYETNKTLIPIAEDVFYEGFKINESTGIILSGSKINIVNNKLQSELGLLYNAQITNSEWLRLELEITDENTIQEIINEEVKFSIQVNKNISDFSIIMDNIELNKICSKNYNETRTIDKSPSFNLEKVVDNKKTWLNKNQERGYDLPIRETKYTTTDERLIINSKEMELSTSIASAIIQDVLEFSVDNDKILLGDGLEGESHTSIDVSNLLSKDYKTLDSVEELRELLCTELINVKSRKSTTNYPTLNMLYERYLDSEELTGNTSNKYTFNSVNKFINLLGGHWVDLIEQVIPSTTLWGSTNRVTNTIFNDNKFKYNRYNLLFCNRNNETSYVETSDVEVIVTTVGEDEDLKDTCNKVYIKQMTDDCSTIGTVIIVGNNGNING